MPDVVLSDKTFIVTSADRDTGVDLLCENYKQLALPLQVEVRLEDGTVVGSAEVRRRETRCSSVSPTGSPRGRRSTFGRTA